MTAPIADASQPTTGANSRANLLGVLAVVVTVLLAGLVTAGPSAAAPPNPLPWTRTYIPDVLLTPEAYTAEVIAACQQDHERGVFDNGAAGKPRYGVVGDSVMNQTRAPALADSTYRWTYLTHCGENFGTTQSSGRLGDVLASNPDVLVGGFGTNNFSAFWQPDPGMYQGFVANFNAFLGASDAVPCRVLFNISERIADYATGDVRDTWLWLIRSANAMIGSINASAHPKVTVIDWKTITQQHPEYLVDDQHLTRAGVNARINLTLSTSRQCQKPDSPANVHAIGGNGGATVWWDALPSEEAVTSYRVTSSLGHTATTTQTTLNVAGLTNATPVSFRVTATNAAGTSEMSVGSETVTPTNDGARFHALAPTRVIDTRDGTGGRFVPLGPKQSFQVSTAPSLPLAAAAASALVLNVTATGQSAESFVTVWPGGQSRPLTSNLNPKPGVAAVAASVTTRTGPAGTISLYNDSGTVHLIADVVGWFDPPGSNSGALYTALPPTRVLDSRTGTGGKNSPFAGATTHTLDLTALPAGATAAVVNLTATNTTSNSFVTLFPAGTVRPLASNLNPQAGLTRANFTTVKVDASGAINVFNNSATTHLLIDLVGYYGAAGALSGGSEYFPITPERHYDSRDGTGGLTGPLLNAQDTVLVFATTKSLPAGPLLSAVDLNLTVVQPSAGGHTTAWPNGARPDTSVLNYQAGEVVPNRNILGIANGMGRFWSAAPSVHYVIDVTGWYGPTL